MPVWRRDGKELFYLTLDRKLMAVTVNGVVGPQRRFEAGTPQALFALTLPQFVAGRHSALYAASPDGQRFLVNSVVESSRGESLTLVVNWPGRK
jgi:hypothetical protein